MKIINNFKKIYLEYQSKANRIITKGEMAESLEITRLTLDVWLNGNVTRYDAPLLERMCDFFGVSLCDLLEYPPALNEKLPPDEDGNFHEMERNSSWRRVDTLSPATLPTNLPDESVVPA